MISRIGGAVHRAAVRAQHTISLALGVDERKRGETVVTMHENNVRRVPGYWIQLFLAMGIATLGLVLGSTAVVIGAMLVSPLMGPLLELGMGFAIGSSLLVIRAFIRVALSVAAVVTGAALITVALPFHEITAEIAARTAPTALDLLVAIFCALTAAYTTVRPGADSTAAAAGTAIGIALVPPLCTIGFGLGTASLDIAGGAALLFTANFSAIILFAVLSFFALGFNQVDAVAVERAYTTDDDAQSERAAFRAHKVLGRLFGSRYGVSMRLLMPAIMLAAVYVPLRHALDEVTWEVRTRDAIRRIIADEAPRAVQTSVIVERHTVALRLLVVGSSSRASTLEQRLTERIGQAAGIVPAISVVRVADARELAAATAAEARQTAPPPQPISDLSQHVDGALTAMWPNVAGVLAGWEVALAASASPTITVRHLGPALGEAGTVLLGTALSTRLGAPVRVIDAPIQPTPIVSRAGRESIWLDSALALLANISAADTIIACVRTPVVGTLGRASDRAILSKLQESQVAKKGRLMLAGNGRWSIQAIVGTCPDSGIRAR